MITSSFEMDVFHQSIDDMSARLAQGDSWHAATGLGTIAAAVSRVDSPVQAYNLVDARSGELGLTVEDVLSPWRTLAFLGDNEALSRVRSIGGIIGTSELELAPGISIEDIDVGGHLIDLAAAGDHAAFPLVRRHILALRRNPEMVYDRTRKAELLHRAGDAEAIDLAVATVHDAREHALSDPSDSYSGYQKIDNSLWGLGSRMIKRRQIARLGEVTMLIGNPVYQARVLSELYASGQDSTGESAERVMNIFNIRDIESLREAYEAIEIFDTLVAGGYEPVVDAYRELLIRSPVEINDENNTSVVKSLVALAKAGAVDAETKLMELTKSRNPGFALISLLDVGHQEYVYNQARLLYAQNPSRFLLKTMLLAKFTTLQWTELWSLPIGDSFIDGRPGEDIYYRANDVLMLAEHLMGSKIHLEKQD